MRTKVASRFLLPVEMLIGLQAIMIGLSGRLTEGALYTNLLETGGDAYWVIGFCAVGVAQFLVAIIEWQCGRTWPLPVVFRFVALRVHVSFAAAACWLVAIAYLLAVANLMISITFIAPLCFGFSAWSFVENFRVKDALDEKVPTSTIVFHR